MDRSFAVIDVEKSLCGDCLLAKMCYRLRIMDDLYDPLVRVRVVVAECGAYKPWQQTAQVQDNKRTA